MEWRAEVGRCGFVSRLRHAMERHARERGGASASGRDKGRVGRDGRAAAAGVTVKCYQSGAERTVAGSSRGVAGSPESTEQCHDVVGWVRQGYLCTCAGGSTPRAGGAQGGDEDDGDSRRDADSGGRCWEQMMGSTDCVVRSRCLSGVVGSASTIYREAGPGT